MLLPSTLMPLLQTVTSDWNSCADLRFNPGTSPADLANIIKDMESLIARKLKKFPDDHRQIVSAKVVMIGNAYRIELESATLP